MAQALVQRSADLQRVAFAFFSVLLDAAPACPAYLHTLHLGPVLLGPCFFQHSMAEQRSGAPRSLFGSMTFQARDGGEESGESAMLGGSDDDGPAPPVFKNIPEERSFESGDTGQSPPALAGEASADARRRTDGAAAAVFAQPLEQHTGFEPVKRGTRETAGLAGAGDVRPLQARKIPSRSQLSESLSHMQSDGAPPRMTGLWPWLYALGGALHPCSMRATEYLMWNHASLLVGGALLAVGRLPAGPAAGAGEGDFGSFGKGGQLAQ